MGKSAKQAKQYKIGDPFQGATVVLIPDSEYSLCLVTYDEMLNQFTEWQYADSGQRYVELKGSPERTPTGLNHAVELATHWWNTTYPDEAV